MRQAFGRFGKTFLRGICFETKSNKLFLKTLYKKCNITNIFLFIHFTRKFWLNFTPIGFSTKPDSNNIFQTEVYETVREHRYILEFNKKMFIRRLVSPRNVKVVSCWSSFDTSLLVR